MRLPITIDFETEPIHPRPHYPPRPVSVAIWEPGRKPEFWAWGHPTENNCTRERVAARLRDVWRSGRELLFHEAAFDLDVAEVHFGLALPPWHRIHDTIYQLFLADPNAEALGLKPASEKYLGWPQEDQEPLKRWIKANVPEMKGKRVGWEAYLCRLPGDMAADRAIGDVRRTRAFHELLYEPSEAYDRERRLLPVRLSMERRGIPVDVAGLEQDHWDGQRMLRRVDRWLRTTLRAPDLDIDKREQLADALEAVGCVDEWLMTAPTKTRPNGTRRTGWEALREVCKDRDLVDVLRYRGILRTQVKTFAEPWLKQARETDGRVFVRFNQVRSASASQRRQVGARTGRLSSTPNLMNVPEAQPILVRRESALTRAEKRGEALWVPLRATRVLDIRNRVRAPRGRLLGDHDYSQQELRILAHLAGGPLADAYRKDPYTDAHAFVHGVVLRSIERAISRRNVKAVNFGVLFGEGLDLLSRKLLVDRSTASRIRRICKGALGAQALDTELKTQQYCVTIGGRVCPVEPPTLVGGAMRTWDYKLINTVIQGSAGDQIKEAMIQVHEQYPDILLLSVHDEILWEAPSRDARALVQPIARIMEECMQLDVPVVAEGAVGRTWRTCH